VGQGRQPLAEGGGIGADLDAERALARRRDHARGLEAAADARAQAEPDQPAAARTIAS
jgi:hypothetical protein